MITLLCQLNLSLASGIERLFVLRQTLLPPFVNSRHFLVILTMINVTIAPFFNAVLACSVAQVFKNRARF
jgi:hypothetical protein